MLNINLGHLRFRRPVPVQPWIEEKPLDASKRTLTKPTQITTFPWYGNLVSNK